MLNDKTLKKYVSSGGTTAYKLPVEAFTNHVTNCYLVMGDPITLLDTASGREESNQGILKCFEGLSEQFGEKVSLKRLRQIRIQIQNELRASTTDAQPHEPPDWKYSVQAII